LSHPHAHEYIRQILYINKIEEVDIVGRTTPGASSFWPMDPERNGTLVEGHKCKLTPASNPSDRDRHVHLVGMRCDRDADPPTWGSL